MNNFLEIKNLTKNYFNQKKINVLKNLNYKFKKGKTYSLVGPSGSGKSTLLNILSLIDRPTNGNLFNISLFPEEIYFLSKMPSEIDPFSILIISLFSIAVTCLVSIYPAIKASNLDTIKSLKYE